MKRMVFFLILAATAVTFGQGATAWNIYGRPTTDWWSGNSRDVAWRWAQAIDRLTAGADAGGAGTGGNYYVDSGLSSAGDGSSWTNALATVDEAVALCTAGNGDRIHVAAGHAEDWTTTDSIDADIAGITIIGYGEGLNRPTFTYDDTDPELVLGAANIHIKNLNFLPSVTAVVHAIEIEADANNCTIENCWFMNGETSGTDEFIDAIQPAALANDISIIGCLFHSYGAAGANTGIDLTAGVHKNWLILGNSFFGDYAEAPIYNDNDVDLRMRIEYNDCHNTNSGNFGIEFGGAATGLLIGNHVYTDAVATAIDPGSLSCFENKIINTTDLTAIDFPPLPAIGTVTAGSADDILKKLYYAADGTGAYPATVANDSTIAKLMAKGATATASTYDNTTDSLEAIADALLTGTSTLAGIKLDHLFAAESDDPADDSVLAKLASKAATANWSDFDNTTDSLQAIADAIAALSGVGFRGTAENNADTSTIISAELAGFGNDYFNTGWRVIVILDADGAGSAPEGEVRDITDYVSATGTFTVDAAFTAAITTSDEIYVRRDEEMAFHDPTLLGSSGTIWYCDDGGSNGDGKTMASAKTTLKATEALASAGDTIIVGANHNENIVAADAVTLNVAGLKVIGLGEGDSRPRFDMDDDGTMITLDAAGILFANMRIMPGVTDCDIALRIEDQALGCVIENVSIIDGEAAGTDEFVDVISVDSLASKLVVRNCTYVSSGNGCGTFVNLDEATIADATIEGCRVFAPMAEAGIWGAAAVPTNVLIKDNIIANGTTGQFAIEFQGAATGQIVDNRLYSDAYATILDPGSCYCSGNLAVDAINEAAIPIPLSATTDDVTEDDDGSDLERLEYLQNKVEDILAGIRMAGGSVGDVYYVDDGGSNGDGTTWATAKTTLDAGWNLTAANVGDIVIVAPAHDEDLGASQVTCDTAGVTIIGIGEGAEQPQIVFNDATSSIDVTAAAVTIVNLNFHSTTAASTIGIDVDAGDFRLEECLLTDTGDNEFTISVDLGATAENAVIRNCKFLSTTGTTGATSSIAITGGVIDRLVIEDCQIVGDFDNAGIYSDQINTNALIQHNSVTNLEAGDHAIELTAAMTGDLVENRLYANTYGAVLDPGSMRCYGNKQCVGTDTGAEDIPLIAGKTYARKMLTGDLNASDDLFSVTGSPIIVTSFLGKCTVACGGATTLKIFCDADDTYDYDLSTSVDVDTVDPGGTLAFTSVVNESVLTVQPVGASGSLAAPIQWWVEEGMLESTVDAGGSTGDMEWYMVFTPVENGCEVIPQ